MDNGEPVRICLTAKNNTIRIDTLDAGLHTVMVCKSTEANIGYLEFAGLTCKKLIRAEPLPDRRIEFIGNSITCGTGSDVSDIGCGKGQWHDQHNAYLSYGPVTARNLQARWVLSSYSGIGMIHSCCGIQVSMPDIFDKINMRDNQIAWDFSRYQPDVVTICLGQNDGIQDSVKFCSAYVLFISKLREVYPRADIVCLNSPMADARLNAVLKSYLTGIVDHVRYAGDKKVHSFFFSKGFNSGCDAHPDLSEHRIIAAELTDFIRKLKNW